MDITDAIMVRIKECGLSVEKVSRELGIDQSTFYRKLAGGSKKFTLEQVQNLIRVLQMSEDDATTIFLGHNSRLREPCNDLLGLTPSDHHNGQ